MDIIDRAIIQKLSVDSRTSFLSISKELGVSEGTVRQRVAKLQNKGIIKKFSLVLGSPTLAIVQIITSSSVPTKKISEKISKLGALSVYEVTGRFTVFAIIQAENMQKLNTVLESIRAIEGVEQTETFPVLKEL